MIFFIKQWARVASEERLSIHAASALIGAVQPGGELVLLVLSLGTQGATEKVLSTGSRSAAD